MSDDGKPEPISPSWTHDKLTTAYRTLRTRFLTAQTARPFQLEQRLHNAHNRHLTFEHEIARLRTHNDNTDSEARARARVQDNNQSRDTHTQETRETLAQALAANETLSTQIKALQSQIDELQTANLNMKNPLKFYHDAIGDASRMQVHNEEFKTQVRGLQDHVENLEAAIDGYQTTIEGLNAEADDRKIEYEDMAREMDEVIGELVGVRKELLRANREFDELRDKNGGKDECKKCEETERRLKLLRNKVVEMGKLNEEDLRFVKQLAGMGDGHET